MVNEARKKAIDKIKRCLALGKSSNEHEAATAMRQAKALMAKYSVEMSDRELSGLNQAANKSTAAKYPSSWQIGLAKMVAEYMDCAVVFSANYNGKAEWLFLGFDANPEVASYAHAVLLRQALRARTNYIKKELSHIQSTGKKTGRADTFCSGWVQTAKNLMGNVAINKEIQDNIIAIYSQGQELSNRNGRVRSGAMADLEAGRIAGASAQLNQAMSKSSAGAPRELTHG